MANFKVGAKVRVINPDFQMYRKEGLVISQSFSGKSWVVRFPDDKDITYKPENLELVSMPNKFSVGDKVWITHKPEKNGVVWVPVMDATIGKQFRVKIVYDDNSSVSLSNGWAYPIECLSHEDPNIKQPAFKVGDKVMVNDSNSTFNNLIGTIKQAYQGSALVEIQKYGDAYYFAPSKLVVLNNLEFKIGSRVRIAEKQHMYYGAVGTITNIYTAVKETFEVTLDVPLGAGVDKFYYCREIFELIFEDSTTINPQPIEIIPEEPSMSSVDATKAVQVVPFIYGRDATVVTDEEIYKHIRKLEDDIAHYKSLKNQPKKLKARLESMQADIDALVKFVDERA
jgi:hypothetical protein